MQGTLRYLSDGFKTLAEYDIPDKAQLLVMVQANVTLKWLKSNLLEGTSIVGNGLICKVDKFPSTQKDTMVSNIFASAPLSAGKHYFVVKVNTRLNQVECDTTENNFSIGVANDQLLNNSVPDQGNFWGIMPYS